MKYLLLMLLFICGVNQGKTQTIEFYKTIEKPDKNIGFFGADNKNIQYTGRFDFTNPNAPRFWAPGTYIQIGFRGTYCNITLNDEELYGQHNYISVIVDGQAPKRIQTTAKNNTIKVAFGLEEGKHTLIICKNTEANIGYLEFVGIMANDVYKLPAKPLRRIEFIGNSITCGAGSDISAKACGEGKWYDQHNAYMSYGPVAARLLGAEWQLSAYSGIGLVHSCCDLKAVMPEVFDKVNMAKDSIQWDFSKYVPQVVTITLGQNDGKQDSVVFCDAYVKFIKTIRSKYPSAHIFCLTSPMADDVLAMQMKNYLTGIVAFMNGDGDNNVHKYFYSKQYHNGCGGHPDLQEHILIANELATYIQQVMKW